MILQAGDQSIQNAQKDHPVPQSEVDGISVLSDGIEPAALDSIDNGPRRRECCDGDASSDDDHHYVTSSTEDDHDNDDDNTSVTLDDSISSRFSLKARLSLLPSTPAEAAEVSQNSETSSSASLESKEEDPLRKRKRPENIPTLMDGAASIPSTATTGQSPKVTDMSQFYQRLNRYAFSCNTSYSGGIVVTIDMDASVPPLIIGDEMELDQSCRQLISNAIYNGSQSAAVAAAYPASTLISSKRNVTLRISFTVGQQDKGHQDDHEQADMGTVVFLCEEVSTNATPVLVDDYGDIRTMAESLGGDFGAKHVMDGETKKKNVAWFKIPCQVPTLKECPLTGNTEATHVVGGSFPYESRLDISSFPSFNLGVRTHSTDSTANKVTPNLVRRTVTLPPLPPLPPSLCGIGGVGGGDFSVIFDQFDDGPTTEHAYDDSETMIDVPGLPHNRPSVFPTLPSLLVPDQELNQDTMDLAQFPLHQTQTVGGDNGLALFDRFRDGPTIANMRSGMSIIPPPQLHVHRQPSLQHLHGAIQPGSDIEFSVSLSQTDLSQENLSEERSEHAQAQTTVDDPTTEEVYSDDEDDSDEGPSQYIIDDGNFRCLVR